MKLATIKWHDRHSGDGMLTVDGETMYFYFPYSRDLTQGEEVLVIVHEFTRFNQAEIKVV